LRPDHGRCHFSLERLPPRATNLLGVTMQSAVAAARAQIDATTSSSSSTTVP